MTVEKLHRGQDIQNSLHQIKGQLKAMKEQNFVLLRGLTNNCHSETCQDAKDIEEQSVSLIMQKLNTRVKELEKEFSKL